MLNNLGGLSSQSNDRQDEHLFTMPHDTSTPYCDNRNCDCHTSVEWHDKLPAFLSIVMKKFVARFVIWFNSEKKQENLKI